MAEKHKIAICEPGAAETQKYFSLRLKAELINEQAVFEAPSRVFIISHIGGDFKSLLRMLFFAGIIDQYQKWIFGDGHLVILGDCLGDEKQVPECLWFIYGLEEKAIRAGGYIHYILGYHELLNLNGEWQYQHPRYTDQKPRSGISYTVLYDGNRELRRWLCTKNIIEKVGDVILMNKNFETKLSIKDTNKYYRPLYTRKDAFILGDLSEEWVDNILLRERAHTVITALPKSDRISTQFDGKLINVFTDPMDHAFEALIIVKNHFYRISSDGSKNRLK